jgi:hypothetical protein
MQIEYLKTADPGLRWMRSFYRNNPQLNRSKALASLQKAERTISDFPTSGHKFQDMDTVFEYPITATNFSLLYTIARDMVWIIDIRDVRGLRSASALRLYTHEFRQNLIRQ